MAVFYLQLQTRMGEKAGKSLNTRGIVLRLEVNTRTKGGEMRPKPPDNCTRAVPVKNIWHD